MTVDVEDFHDGMAALGHDLPVGTHHAGDLAALGELLAVQASRPKVTLFVVAGYAAQSPDVRFALEEFSRAGHEIACHGPDHGRLPHRDLVSWLKKGKEMLEDLVQVPVRGFRSPRFDIPAHGDLTLYREELAQAGYEYVSDASHLGATSPVKELPVLCWRGVRVGGGSYQRILPLAFVQAAVARCSVPAVLYYHSYDFDHTVVGRFGGAGHRLTTLRSLGLARQVVGRGRIAPIFARLAERFGSEGCARAIR